MTRFRPRQNPKPAEASGAIRTLAALQQAGLSPATLWEELARDPANGDVPTQMVAAIASGANPHDAVRAVTQEASPSWRALGACWAIARTSGAPLAPALWALAEALGDISRTNRQITAALAGPRATMRLVMALPVIGVVGGQLGGQSSASFLFTTPLGATLLLLGITMMAGAWWWLRLLAARATPPTTALSLELDLLAVATGGGALPEKAQALVTSMCSEYGLELGDPEALGDVVSLSRRAGIPVSGLATAKARLRRDLARTDAEERMAKLGVSVVMPLGLLVLPAFVVVAVVPMAVVFWQGSLG